jgi:hypothetical protein
VLQSIALLYNYSFCPFSPTLSPCPHLPLPFSLTCHQTTPPYYTLTTCWLTYYTNFTQPQPPAISDISTLHYNRNTPKHTQGPQNLTAPTELHPLAHSTPTSPFSATLNNSPNFYR